jgi:hypothetical protein
MFYGAGVSQQPLLSYSDRQERATLVRDFVDSPELSMPPRRRRGRPSRVGGASAGHRRRKGVRKHRVKGAKGVRVTKGRVAIRLAGHGVTKLAASQLVRYVPLNKLKSAAKKVLKSQGHRRSRKVRRKRRKGRKKRRTTRRRRRA